MTEKKPTSGQPVRRTAAVLDIDIDVGVAADQIDSEWIRTLHARFRNLDFEHVPAIRLDAIWVPARDLDLDVTEVLDVDHVLSLNVKGGVGKQTMVDHIVANV